MFPIEKLSELPNKLADITWLERLRNQNTAYVLANTALLIATIVPFWSKTKISIPNMSGIETYTFWIVSVLLTCASVGFLHQIALRIQYILGQIGIYCEFLFKLSFHSVMKFLKISISDRFTELMDLYRTDKNLVYRTDIDKYLIRHQDPKIEEFVNQRDQLIRDFHKSRVYYVETIILILIIVFSKNVFLQSILQQLNCSIFFIDVLCIIFTILSALPISDDANFFYIPNNNIRQMIGKE